MSITYCEQYYDIKRRVKKYEKKIQMLMYEIKSYQYNGHIDEIDVVQPFIKRKKRKLNTEHNYYNFNYFI